MRRRRASSRRPFVATGRAKKTGRKFYAFRPSKICDGLAPCPRNPSLTPVADDRGIFDSQGARHSGLSAKLSNQIRHTQAVITLCDKRQHDFYVVSAPQPNWLVLRMPRMSRSEEYKRECGFRLAAAREAIGLTQKKAAKAVGVSTSAWGNWESGTRLPDVGAMNRFTDIYGETFLWIFRGSLAITPADLAGRIMAEWQRIMGSQRQASR
jgi:DNA-binding XRE family transcriptional regulator